MIKPPIEDADYAEVIDRFQQQRVALPAARQGNAQSGDLSPSPIQPLKAPSRDPQLGIQPICGLRPKEVYAMADTL